MGSKQKISPVIRAISGLLGIGGLAAIVFDTSKSGGIEPDFVFLVSMLGGAIFLYAALVGSIPWDVPSTNDGKQATMTRNKWRMFWGAFVVFSVMMVSFLFEEGIFAEADLVILGIVGLLLCMVGIALYVYVKGRSDDLG